MIAKLFKIPQGAMPYRSLMSKQLCAFNISRKLQRTIQKGKETQLQQQGSNIATDADLDQKTDTQLNNINSQRQEYNNNLQNETKLPIQALLLGLSVTLPLLGGSGYLYHQLIQNAATSESFIPLFNTIIKGIGLHQCFQSGVHWGFAVSLQNSETTSSLSNSETDSHHNNPQTRLQFVLACIPVISALGNTFSMVYGIQSDGLLNITPILIMVGTQIFLLGLDMKAVRDQHAPKWYMNLKIIISLICFASYGLYAGMILNYGEQIKTLKLNRIDPFRKYIPTDTEILKNPVNYA